MGILPEYEAAVVSCWREGSDLLMRANDPVLAQIPFERRPHLSDGTTTPATSVGHQGAPTTVETSFTVDTAAFLSLDLSAWDAALLAHSEDALPQVMKGVFETLDAATKQVGNVIDGKGQKISHDLMLDALEAVQMDFDDEGNPTRMTWVMSPQMVEAVRALGPPTEEHERRHREIMRKKWEQHLARRRVRQLDK